MRCPQCQSEIQEGIKFCSECGAKLLTPCPQCGTPVAPGTKFCPECGAKLMATCPQCGTAVAPGTKFCPECGTPLVAACPQCGTSVSPGTKFCPECGTPLTAAPPPPPAPPPVPPAPADSAAEQLKRLVPREYAERLQATRGQAQGERRVVTILFSDVKGSTAMAESLDPEDVMDIMNGAFEFLISPVYRYEGTLARMMGDAILAFFGAPIAHEDDPERAIRAALEIVAGAQEYAARLEKERGIEGFNVRVGINTGLVVVGEVGTDMRVEYTAMGDAINTAARMEQAAPIGGVLISHNTYQYVRGLFEVQTLEPVSVKGKAEPVQVYAVQKAKPRAFHLGARGVEGIVTPTIGREAELQHLYDAFARAHEQGTRQMVTVVSEAGIGKSRLLYEFMSWLELQPHPIRQFRGRARAEMRGQPYALLRNMIASAFEIQDSDPVEVVWEKMETGFSEAFEQPFEEPSLRQQTRMQMGVDHAHLRAHILGQLLGFDFSRSPHVQAIGDDARQLHDRGLLYLLELLQAGADEATTVLLLEDLHWADDSSLDTIEYLALALGAANHAPLLIIANARPPLLERRPRWGQDQEFHSRLELQPLTAADSLHLVDAILQKVIGLPPTLRELIGKQAEGNPLYIEELIKMLIEEKVIVTDGPGASPEVDYWQVDLGRLAEVRVPPTMAGIIQARLDSLPLIERGVLQQSAVVGRIFWDHAVARLAHSANQATDTEGLSATLSALRGREMIYRHETSDFAGSQEYIFKHPGLREVAYEGILKKVRRGYHALVGAWLAEQSGARAGEYGGLIAEHLELAGDLSGAFSYLRQAAEQAAARYANAEAVEYFGHALQLLERLSPDPAEAREQEYALRLGREGVYRLLGQREPQRVDLERLAALAEEMEDNHRRAQVARHKAAYHEAISDFPASVAAAQQAIEWAERDNDAQQKTKGLILWGIARWRQGQLEESREHLEEALSLARQQGDRPNEAASLHSLGTVSYFLGKHQAAREALEQALQIRRDLGNRRSESASLNNLVGVYHGLGDLAKAKATSQQALAIQQAIGDRVAETMTLSNLAQIHHALGDLPAACECYERSLALSQVIGNRGMAAIAMKNMGMALNELGDPYTAQQYCEQALVIDQETGNRRGEGYSLTYLAITLEGTGEIEGAAAAYAEALKLRRELGQEALGMDALAGLARVALQQGQPAEALAHAEEILDWIGEHGVQGMDDPVRVHLAVADALTAAEQGERAAQVLAAAQSLVQERAARIGDEAARQSFLENVPLHAQLRKRLG